MQRLFVGLEVEAGAVLVRRFALTAGAADERSVVPALTTARTSEEALPQIARPTGRLETLLFLASRFRTQLREWNRKVQLLRSPK